jgi:threonine dehydrogenase-like Zn-dependent dehydrogenase
LISCFLEEEKKEVLYFNIGSIKSKKEFNCMEFFDIVIIGGGPIGIACGLEAKKKGLTYVILLPSKHAVFLLFRKVRN